MNKKQVSAHTLTKNSFEQIAWQQELTVCGIDEVGRGSLAGPVVACALILPIGQAPDFLRDSKEMTERQRIQAAAWIATHCIYAFGIVNNHDIDSNTIYQSTLQAMKKALINLYAQCTQLPSAVLIDAMPLQMRNTHYAQIPIHHFCKGESLSSSIAAASIMAKVYRDDLMNHLHNVFPGYGLNRHKGYGTAQHQAAIIAKQHSLMHRRTFLTTIYNKRGEYAKQQSLC